MLGKDTKPTPLLKKRDKKKKRKTTKATHVHAEIPSRRMKRRVDHDNFKENREL